MMLAYDVKEIVNGDEIVNNIIDLVIERLEETWKIKEINEYELAFSVNSTIEKIKNYTNQLMIPEGLTFTTVNRICGDFLQNRLNAGKLPEFNVEQAIKTLKIGDTSTTFQNAGNSGIELLIANLNGKDGDLISHRKLKW